MTTIHSFNEWLRDPWHFCLAIILGWMFLSPLMAVWYYFLKGI